MQDTNQPETADTMIDPVCGMTVAATSPHRHQYQDVDYRFCYEGCQQKFARDPEYYLSGAAQQDIAPVPGALYICPMDPEIEQDHPGSCPICGMALEVSGPPVLATRTEYTCPMHPEIAEESPGNCPVCGMALEARTIEVEERNEELIDMRRRLRISLVLAIPVFLLAMIADMAPALLPDSLPMPVAQWIQFLLATPVVLWCGWPFFQRGWQSLRSWNLNMFTLIAIGVGVAWIYSVVALLFPAIFPPSMMHSDGTVAVYFEAAAVIIALVLLGQVMELRARSQTNAAIKLLLGLAPNTARIVRDDGQEEDIALDQVVAGDIPARQTRRKNPG